MHGVKPWFGFSGSPSKQQPIDLHHMWMDWSGEIGPGGSGAVRIQHIRVENDHPEEKCSVAPETGSGCAPAHSCLVWSDSGPDQARSWKYVYKLPDATLLTKMLHCGPSVRLETRHLRGTSVRACVALSHEKNPPVQTGRAPAGSLHLVYPTIIQQQRLNPFR